MKTRILALLLCVVMCVSLFAGCSNEKNPSNETTAAPGTQETQEAVKADPFGKFDETVVITMGKADIPDNKLPDGQTIEDNMYLRLLKERLNVEIKYDWLAQGDAFKQKLALTLSSGNLPDVMCVDRATLSKLVEADLIADLTDAYEANASDYIKSLYASSPNNATLNSVTFDGKMMAIPDQMVQINDYSLLWVRSDWMEKLNLPEPKTLEDIKNIARAFIEKDPDGNGENDTLGITGSDVLNGINTIDVFNPIFNSVKAYPNAWVKNDKGEIVYGSTLPEVKDALQILRDMYAEGLIDPEFATRAPWTDNQALRASGKSGMFFAPAWIGWSLIDTVANNPEADWVAYMVPPCEDGKVRAVMAPSSNAFLVVRKDYEHLDAVIRTLNLQQECIDHRDQDFMENWWPEYMDLGYTVTWNNWPFDLSIAFADCWQQRGVIIADCLAEKADPKEMDEVTFGWYEQIVDELANPKADLNDWATAVVALKGIPPVLNAEIELIPNYFYGSTPTMEQKMATLNKMESETFLKIIMGKEPIEAFDSFVEQWHSLGGDQITEEVRAAAN